MKRAHIFSAVAAGVLPLAVGGCVDVIVPGREPDGPDLVTDLDVGLTGIGIESATPGVYAFGAFGSVTTSGSPIGFGVETHQHISVTNGFVGIHVTELVDDDFYDYDVLMGSPFDAVGTAEGWLEHSAPIFRIETNGWLFAWGILPVVRDRWIAAAASGSTIALEVLDAAAKHSFVYFISQGTSTTSEVDVVCLSTMSSIFTLTTEGTFVEIINCVPVTNGLVTDPAVLDFVTDVQDAATSAGWTE